MKIYHHTDPDGWASAWICKKHFNEIWKDHEEGLVFIGIGYDFNGDFSNVKKNETVIIVDMSFKPEKFNELLSITKNVIWIDHHKTILGKEYKQFSELMGIRSIEKAACNLTWDYFFTNQDPPRFIKLIGDYDIWKFEYGLESRYFIDGCSIHDLTPNSDFWDNITGRIRHFFVKVIEEGKAVHQYKQFMCERYLNNCSHTIELDGYIGLAVNVYGHGSDMFDSLSNNEKSEFQFYALYSFNGNNYCVSLRTDRNDMDVEKLAKNYGGGGHVKASGFHADVLPWKNIGKFVRENHG